MADINELRNKMDAVTLEMINLLKTKPSNKNQIVQNKKNKNEERKILCWQ